uniref:Uncharacterized protein n=1 Tax=Arundo donax TaxID=35708 RepID=A0A0A8ZH78_ARUDO
MTDLRQHISLACESTILTSASTHKYTSLKMRHWQGNFIFFLVCVT